MLDKTACMPQSGHMTEDEYTLISTADDVTEEILEIVRDIESGWYNDVRIDWEDVWDRMDGTTLNNGKRIDMGGDLDSPAMKKIKKVIREERRQG